MKTLLEQLNMFFAPDDGTGAGGGAGDQGDKGGAAGGDKGAGAGGDKGAQGDQGGKPATQQQQVADKQYSYKEDRSKWLPPHREKEIRTSTETRVKSEMQKEIDTLNGRVRALAGLEPVAGNIPAEVGEARNAFLEVFPEFKPLLTLLTKKFGEQDALTALTSLAENSGQLTQSADYIWSSLGTRTLNRLWEQAETQLGYELTDSRKNRMFAAFRAELQSNPEFNARYEQEDPKLVEDFVKSFVEDFIAPVRGKTQMATRQSVRTPLPRGGGGGQVQVVTKPAKIPVGNIDAAMDAAVNYMKERGEEFSD